MNNQDAFDIAVLHLLNQGHRCVSSAGQSQLRGTRGGKSALGGLIPDRLYWKSMEGKTVPQLLTGSGPGYDSLREHFSGVTPHLLTELQDLHDRSGSCLPSLFRDIIRDGAQRIARIFGLSARMMHLWAAYRRLSGPPRQHQAEPIILDSVPATVSRYSSEASAVALN